MSADKIIAALTENPRATAQEVGATIADMKVLQGRGLVIEYGKRTTGRRGRPPIEWVVAGTDVSHDAVVQESVQRAEGIVRAHRLYEKLSRAILAASQEFGYNSPERTEAVLLRKETFTILPPLPSKNDYVLAGEMVDDDIETEVAA